MRSEHREDQKIRQHRRVPELRNGDTTPDSGSAPNTPALISSISKAISADSPSARNIPYAFGARSAARIARATRNPNSRNTAATPQNPHSSPIAGKHQVRVARGNHCRIAPARPRSEGAARRERPQRMRQLIAAVHVVVPGRQPHVDAIHHRVRLAQVVTRRHAADQQHDAASTRPARPRATPNIARNRKPVTSAGPRSFRTKKSTSANATAHITGSTCEARQPDSPEQARE